MNCSKSAWDARVAWAELQQHLKNCAGDIVAVGDGKVGEVTQEFDLGVGETILYSKFGIGATDISVQGALHVLIREDDVIGTLPRSGATAADVPELKPAADRVLIKVTSCLKLYMQVPPRQINLAPPCFTSRTSLEICHLAVGVAPPRLPQFTR